MTERNNGQGEGADFPPHLADRPVLSRSNVTSGPEPTDQPMKKQAIHEQILSLPTSWIFTHTSGPESK